jgi:hypothetical protein
VNCNLVEPRRQDLPARSRFGGGRVGGPNKLLQPSDIKISNSNINVTLFHFFLKLDHSRDIAVCPMTVAMLMNHFRKKAIPNQLYSFPIWTMVLT